MSFKQRLVKIKNYRNIAVNQKEEFRLILNNYYGDNEADWADLVILIGPNNIGKSNILDSLLLWNDDVGYDGKKDVTDYTIQSSKHYPETKFIIKSGTSNNLSEDIVCTKSMSDENHTSKAFSRPTEFRRRKLDDDETNFIVALARTINNLFPKSTNAYYPPTKPLPKEISRSSLDSCLKSEFSEIKYDFVLSMYNYLKNNNKLNPSFISQSMINGTENYLKSLKKKLAHTEKEMDELLVEKWKVKIHPKVVKYDDKPITNDEVAINTKDIDNLEQKSPILWNLFRYIGFDANRIKECSAGKIGNIVVQQLDGLSDEIQNQLEPVVDMFNKLLPIPGGTKYGIEVLINPTSINLILTKNNIPLDIEKQSTGFTWFFNFFFNFIIGHNLSAGDIVLLDEPCAGLHEEGVKEFYDLLKNTIKKTGITFVVVTHRASFINVDFLEEVRQIAYRDGNLLVENKFNAVPLQASDALKPVLDSLLSGRNHIFDNRTSVPVFVEGITDYCYFTGYKQISESDRKIDLIFLPVEGLKKENHKEVVEKIHNLELASILLVDGDGPGIETQNDSLIYQNIKTISLKDINDSFNFVEDLFAEEDRQKYNLGSGLEESQKPEKDFDNGVLIKKMFKCDGGISDITKGNFKQVFDYLYKFLDENEIGFVRRKKRAPKSKQAKNTDSDSK